MNIFRVSSALRRSAPHRISSSSLSLEQSVRQPTRLRFFSAAGNDANANANANTNANTDSHSQSHSHSDSSPTDFFRLFGLPRKFGIRQSELKGTYLRLMNEYHPDKQRHVVAKEDDGDALLTAETITHAYQILKAPHTRAAHWLELHGCPLYDDDAKASASASASASANGSGQTELVGVEFLAEMMEWRERIEDATTTTTEDSGGTDPAFSRRNRLQALAEETRPLRESCEASLDQLLDERKGFSEGNAGATLAEARKLVAQLQYWNRLDETLRDAGDA